MQRGRVGNVHNGTGSVERQCAGVLACGRPGGVRRRSHVSGARCVGNRSSRSFIKGIRGDKARNACQCGCTCDGRITAEISRGVNRANSITVCGASRQPWVAERRARRRGNFSEGRRARILTLHAIAGHGHVVGRGCPTQIDLARAGCRCRQARRCGWCLRVGRRRCRGACDRRICAEVPSCVDWRALDKCT